MQGSHRRLAVVLILAGLQAAACAQQKSDPSSTLLGEGLAKPGQSKPGAVEQTQGTNLSRVTPAAKAAERPQPSALPSPGKPSRLEKVQGTEVSRVILSQKAAERIGLEMGQLREEQIAPRKRLVGGEVVKPATPADGGTLWVRVSLSEGDLRTVATAHPVRVMPLAREADKKATTARAVKDDTKAKEPALHYAIDSGGHGLALGQRVGVELALNGAGTRKVVPHAAVVYDAKGKTWVYVGTDSLTFVRQPIRVDYVDGDLAVLSDGPAAGTKVVTVGAAELLGTEYGK